MQDILGEVNVNGLPYWLAGIFAFFLELLRGITGRKESISLYIKASIII